MDFLASILNISGSSLDGFMCVVGACMAGVGRVIEAHDSRLSTMVKNACRGRDCGLFRACPFHSVLVHFKGAVSRGKLADESHGVLTVEQQIGI